MRTNTGDWLIELREGLGLTQRDAAVGMGLSAPTLCNLERGLRPTAEQAYVLGKYYGVDMMELWNPPEVVGAVEANG